MSKNLRAKLEMAFIQSNYAEATIKPGQSSHDYDEHYLEGWFDLEEVAKKFLSSIPKQENVLVIPEEAMKDSEAMISWLEFAINRIKETKQSL